MYGLKSVCENSGRKGRVFGGVCEDILVFLRLNAAKEMHVTIQALQSGSSLSAPP